MSRAEPATGAEHLPEIRDEEITAVTEWLQSRERTQRRPEATAKLLILAVKLYRTRTPWPTRPAIAEHLGVSLPLVDVAISQRRAEGLIKVVIETTQGHVRQRKSVITHKFIEPCEELAQIVADVPPSPPPKPRRSRRTSVAT